MYQFARKITTKIAYMQKKVTKKPLFLVFAKRILRKFVYETSQFRFEISCFVFVNDVALCQFVQH